MKRRRGAVQQSNPPLSALLYDHQALDSIHRWVHLRLTRWHHADDGSKQRYSWTEATNLSHFGHVRRGRMIRKDAAQIGGDIGLAVQGRPVKADRVAVPCEQGCKVVGAPPVP